MANLGPSGEHLHVPSRIDQPTHHRHPHLTCADERHRSRGASGGHVEHPDTQFAALAVECHNELVSSHLEGKSVVVTGGGRGHRPRRRDGGGRGAGRGVVVADYGGAVDRNAAGSSEAADAVVDEITAAGGEAVAAAVDVSTMDGGRAVVDAAMDAFGRLDADGVLRRHHGDEVPLGASRSRSGTTSSPSTSRATSAAPRPRRG